MDNSIHRALFAAVHSSSGRALCIVLHPADADRIRLSHLIRRMKTRLLSQSLIVSRQQMAALSLLSTKYSAER